MKSPAETIIEKLGGLSKVARLRGIAVSTVQGWKERGKIPPEYWLSLIEDAGALGVTLSLEDFLLPTPHTGEAA